MIIISTEGKEETAIECFRKVLEFDPKHKGAVTAMRVINTRKEKEQKGGGLFGRRKR